MFIAIWWERRTPVLFYSFIARAPPEFLKTHLAFSLPDQLRAFLSDLQVYNIRPCFAIRLQMWHSDTGEDARHEGRGKCTVVAHGVAWGEHLALM